MIAQINHVIGAEGVVSLECKKVVSKYGDLIWELLISGVAFFPSVFLLTFLLLFSFPWVGERELLTCYFSWCQLQPRKVCVDIGLCLYNQSRWSVISCSVNILCYPEENRSILSPNSHEPKIWIHCSAAIETMVDITNSQGLPDDGSALCNFCEMTVFWLQVEFQKNRAKEKVFRYVNEVIFLFAVFGMLNICSCSRIASASIDTRWCSV